MPSDARRAVVLGIASVCLMPAPTRAIEGAESPPRATLMNEPAHADPRLAALLSPKPGEKVCFARIYDARHLRAHPKQKIVAMGFLLKFETLAPGHFGSKPESERTYYQYSFGMTAKLKGQARPLYQAGECGPDHAFSPDGKTGAPRPGTRRPVIFCTVEEDGGAVAIEKVEGAEAMMLRFEPPLDRLRMVPRGGTQEEDGVEIEPGADDRAFRLERMSAAACRALDREIAKAW
jgi:hypothetical protein